MAHSIPTIVVTGGPNGGKTSILLHLKLHFERMGYTVVVVPEVATQLITLGQGPAIVGMEEFQRLVIAKSIEQEKAALSTLEYASRPLIIADRGYMDGAAYVDRVVIQRVWRHFDYNLIRLRDESCAGVLHLESTAVGLPHLYEKNCADNPARYENVEHAARTDRRTLAAWVGTPHLAYIDNSTDFPGKVARAIRWAEYFVSGKEHERKFVLLTPFNGTLLPAHSQCVDIRQWYCQTDAEKFRIRMRGQDGIHAYTKTVKVHLGGMSNDEDEVPLTEQEFAHLHGTCRVPGLSEVAKERWCFVENGIYFEFDVFRDIPLVMMESELPDPSWPVTLPDWGEWLEVTSDQNYTNRAIAERITRSQNAA